MGHVKDEGLGTTPQRVPAGTVEADGPLYTRIAALEHELAALRRVALEKESLEESLAQLREANQNLVVAALNAQSSRDDAEEATRRQTEFLAMLAHELRNPLAPIRMAATLLARSPEAVPSQLSMAQVIGRQVDHMARLLDDLLDAARISSGKILLSMHPVTLAEIVEQAVETVGPRVRERGQQLLVTLPDRPVTLVADKVRLTQVFTNLLANASKYTAEQGTVRLGAECRDGQVVVTVEDNGYGIGAELLPHVFDLFTQGPRSLARSEGGLGVGLNVVRNLVGMHGGAVNAFSGGQGTGSSFTVVLPMSHGQAPARKAPLVAARPAALRLLLVEDNVDACETLQRFLSLEGHEVHVAYDGKAGLEAAAAGDYDAVICDIGLPAIDGLELISQLRGAADGRRPYAIALSGYCQPEDRARALNAGFDEYCVKPVDPDELLGMLAVGCSLGSDG
jgi:signal transduction histidine kinase/CheY-like chemotaxis protein